MKNYWFIGDIHGEIGLLDSLLDAILKYKPDHITFLGDYIDRGPHSRKVVDRIMGMEVPVTCLMGNHELMMLNAMEDSIYGNNPMELWYRNGGEATLLSFGFPGFFSFLSQMEEEYLDFFRTLRMSHMLEPWGGMKILATHAGVSPAIPVTDQLLLKDYQDLQQYMLDKELDQSDSFLWARENFFDASPDLWKGYLVVHGHTPALKLRRYMQQDFRPDFQFVENDLAIRRNGEWGEIVSVCIDSGSTISGRLSGIGIFADGKDPNTAPGTMRSITVAREEIIPRELGPIGP